jgi:hypothetical protein
VQSCIPLRICDLTPMAYPIEPVSAAAFWPGIQRLVSARLNHA